MWIKILRISFFLLLPLVFSAQSRTQNLVILDAESHETIKDAHVFLGQSQIGDISDSLGQCQLSIPDNSTQDLIVTHLSYDVRIISPSEYFYFDTNDTIRLAPRSIDISQIEIQAERSKLWKKRFRKFTKAFIGEGKPANNCTILNPEVLRFEENKDSLVVTAIDLIKIENSHLAYTIDFWLEECIVEKDGSSSYRGFAAFKESPTESNSEILALKQDLFEKSLQHFLIQLTNCRNLEELSLNGFALSQQSYADGIFTTLPSFELDDILSLDSLSGIYKLSFSDFLTINHTELWKDTNGANKGLSGLEQQRFGSGQNTSISTVSNVVSRLYKVDDYVLFDRQGIILNKSVVKEYGYWAEQKVSTTLPVDYQSRYFSGRNVVRHQEIDTIKLFINLLNTNAKISAKYSELLDKHWHDGYQTPLLEILRLSTHEPLNTSIKRLLNKHNPQLKTEYFDGISELWKLPPNQSNYYADFKAYLYQNIDSKFNRYFNGRADQSRIRMDEILWGGVKQDGIPPLHNPKMITQQQADYLADSDIVFGLGINGEYRAYPQRILAWHEFFTDQIDDLTVAGVYCTLCGTVIIYESTFDSVKYELGTSGFLYRSNKLMYDKATQSLWSTIEGKPVVGPLVDKNIELNEISVLTTTWGEWKQSHPETKVLSLDTGYNRNYSEGEAYKDYYSTDALMFPVPQIDNRLKNKDRVFIPRIQGYADDPLAIALNYLQSKGIHQDTIGNNNIVVLTESNGSSRAYKIEEQIFESYQTGILLDKENNTWLITDEYISHNEKQYHRIEAHESFWFAWYNAFPNTRLVF